MLASVLMAWTQLFGMVSFELSGHLVGSVDPSGDFFGYAVERMADLIGLPPPGTGAGDPAEAVTVVSEGSLLRQFTRL